MYLTLATINKQGTGHDPISQFTSKQKYSWVKSSSTLVSVDAVRIGQCHTHKTTFVICGARRG